MDEPYSSEQKESEDESDKCEVATPASNQNKAWTPFIFDATHLQSNHTISIGYNTTEDSYYINCLNKENQNPLIVQDFNNGAIKSNNMYRKIERDWYMVYLSRSEHCTHRDAGYIEWYFDTSAISFIVSAFIRAESTTFHDAAQVVWSVRANNSKKETVILGSEAVDVIPTLRKLIPANEHITSFYLRATLSGGVPNSGVAWQHAQLFRISYGDHTSTPFQVTLTIDPPPTVHVSALPALQNSFTLNDKETSDLKIHISDKVIYAHKQVLEKRSDYFNAMLSSGMREASGTIQMNDVSYKPFYKMMQFLYTGSMSEKPLSVEKIVEVLMVANEYSVTPLVQYCESLLVPEINQSNAIEIKKLLVDTEAQQVVLYCDWYLRHHKCSVDNKCQLS